MFYEFNNSIFKNIFENNDLDGYYILLGYYTTIFK